MKNVFLATDSTQNYGAENASLGARSDALSKRVALFALVPPIGEIEIARNC